MKRDRFSHLVTEALGTIPRRFRDRIQNLALIVEDWPSADLLEEMDVEPGDTLFGLYQGTPLTSRPWDYGNTLPDRILIFQGPIEEACRQDEAAAGEDDEELFEEDVITEIGLTLIHEVGHYFGLSEDEIEEIEERYWRDRAGEDEEPDQ